nr:porin [uncultured Flavobacterium sp.]
MLKKSCLILLLSFCSLLHSQEQEETQLDSTTLNKVPLIKISKEGSITKDLKMIAHVRFALNNNFEEGNFVNSQFRANDTRMEIIGKVSEKIKVRFRDVYSRSAGDATTVDLLRRSIDLTYVEYEVNDKLDLVAGKMFGEFGGYEIFHNPITMVAYNDWINNGDIFLSGLKTNYHLNPNHRLSFQIVNSSSRSFDNNYATTPDVKASKVPFAYTINWNGNFINKTISTKWSYSNFTVLDGAHSNILVIGTQFKKNNLSLQYDFKYIKEDIDRTGIISTLIGNEFTNRVKKTVYAEHWLRGEYFFTPNISIIALGMVSSSYWHGNPDTSSLKNNLIRNTWTYTSSLEYYLNKQHNIKLFLSYVSKNNKISEYAKNQFDLNSNNTGQILFGVMSHFHLF